MLLVVLFAAVAHLSWPRWCVAVACRSLGGKLVEMATGGVISVNGSCNAKLDAPAQGEDSVQTACMQLAMHVRTTALYNAGRVAEAKDGDDDDEVTSESAREDAVSIVPDATHSCALERLQKWVDSATAREAEDAKVAKKGKVCARRGCAPVLSGAPRDCRCCACTALAAVPVAATVT